MSIPFEFVLFALTLLSVALFHRFAMHSALAGALVIVGYKLVFADFHGVPGLTGLAHLLGEEWALLTNLFGLLTGFALLSAHFEESRLPERLPDFLPDNWLGGFLLLVIVFLLSGFLDNIAAAIIGGSVAATIFRGRVHIGYLAGLTAASNAGGAGSVLGDTTTTMMWIDGVSPFDVLHAYLPAATALLVFGIPAALRQHRHSPIAAISPVGLHIDWVRAGIVGFVLFSLISANVTANLKLEGGAESLPILGMTLWLALLIASPLRRPNFALVPEAVRGSLFLLALVFAASMMPVESLPDASWQVALGLGFLSAVFDNIPLTKLALDAGGYDWGFLAYAVGFGGSMIWFGSSAGVALSNRFPEARSAMQWLRHGWHIAIAYVAGFMVLLWLWGWQPHPAH
ncbi:MAG: hypothetical protein R3E77_09815 [Steroidobacteraceae bacterium]